MIGPEVIAHRAQISGTQAKADQIHHQEQQCTGEHPLMRLNRFLNESHGRREIKIVEKCRGSEKRQRERPARCPGEADEERNCHAKPQGRHERVGAFRGRREPIDQPSAGR